MSFGDNLKALLQERGMTQKELARKTGLTEASVSRYVNETRNPKIISAIRIAQALNLPLNKLMER